MFHLWDLSPMGSTLLFLFIYVLFSLFHRWLFGMVLRKGNPWKRDFIGFLPGFFSFVIVIPLNSKIHFHSQNLIYFEYFDFLSGSSQL